MQLCSLNGPNTAEPQSRYTINSSGTSFMQNTVFCHSSSEPIVSMLLVPPASTSLEKNARAPFVPKSRVGGSPSPHA